ncbi:SpoIIE family protein phosphatase [Streptomyces sp. AK02-01A]|uniref:SpoIIE family protein phosphatase n=1 Tax=Streptomyces sp. AK02-01A TaxID=3028648 RepID=UPI0029AEE070|nr:SpoIIE family protein phosphatase [Streptomyces sp. AK02-01A]MDX3853105.1 SpoIIE family protein phosphatase [Streptomyces sp. AK02-01A]
MNTSAWRESGGEVVEPTADRVARLLVGADGMVTDWGSAAERLLGYRARDVLGRPVADLLAMRSGADSGYGEVVLRHRDGHSVRCRLRVEGQDGMGPCLAVELSPAGRIPPSDVERALLEALFTRSPIGLILVDPQLRLVRFNAVAEGMHGTGIREVVGLRPTQAWPEFSGETVERVMGEVLRTGEPVIEFEKRGRPPGDPAREHVYSASAFRLQARDGRILGVADVVVDVTERHRAEQRLALMAEASARIGTTLDLLRTAQELAELVVPRLTDSVSVDILDPVFGGERIPPGPVTGTAVLRRAASCSRRTDTAPGAYATGEISSYPGDAPACQVLADLTPRLVRDITEDSPWVGGDPVRGRKMLENHVHSLMLVPLVVRGRALGLVCFYRWATADGPFDEDDLALAVDLTSRAAVALDNGRRYIRERNAVLALQQGMLPQRFPTPRAVDWAHHMIYSGAGGDWTDVIPLPGARVALVTGSTPGRGVRTAATMGRLRAAVHTLANLDQAPNELLARLDDLVRALGRETGETSADTPVGATCLYLVYDPVNRCVSMASAGHPAPILAQPDGTVTVPAPPAGEALGCPGPPFEKAAMDLPEGSLIVLHTRGLLQKFPARIGSAELEHLVTSPTGSPQNLSLTLTETLVPSDPHEDAAVLVARTRPLDPDSVAVWDLPSDPAAVATARQLATRQLAAWGLAEEDAFATELIVSELVTNAIRYAAPPIRLRLIRDRALTCEVSDSSSAAPFLRHARTTDEGGRGLLLVAQLAERWGTRYQERGKIIWTEQPITA